MVTRRDMRGQGIKGLGSWGPSPGVLLLFSNALEGSWIRLLVNELTISRIALDPRSRMGIVGLRPVADSTNPGVVANGLIDSHLAPQ